MGTAGRVVILNGAPRSGKTSIVTEVQAQATELWINLGVDVFMVATPSHLRPGVGLRPGGERPDIEAALPALYGSLWAAVAAQATAGVNVVVDVGHHENYRSGFSPWAVAVDRLGELPVVVVGVRCPIQEVLRRRADHVDRAPVGDADYLTRLPDGTIPEPIELWQSEVHRPGLYDIEIDTSASSPARSASLILKRLAEGPRGTAIAAIGAQVGAGRETRPGDQRPDAARHDDV